jgi:LCP family protein required for cell wall assembly
MFDHLDDAHSFVPDDDFRKGVHRRGRHLRLVHRATKVAGGLAATVAVVGLAGTLYVDRRDAAIDRVEVEAPPSVDGAINILLVGLDHGTAGREEAEGIRPDTIVLVRLNTDGSIGLLSLPRDLLLPDGERLNQHRTGGAQDLIDAITGNTGVPIDHYIEMGMNGLVALVDEAGGLPIAVDRPLVDDNSGLYLQPSACATIDGETALALVRARHIDQYSELSRMTRARAVLGAALIELGRASDDVGRIDEVTQILADHATLDEGLTLDRLADIGGELAQRSESGAPVDSPDLPLVDSGDGATLSLGPDAIAVLHDFGAPEDFEIPGPPEGAVGLGVDGGPLPPLDPAIGPCEQIDG